MNVCMYGNRPRVEFNPLVCCVCVQACMHACMYACIDTGHAGMLCMHAGMHAFMHAFMYV